MAAESAFRKARELDPSDPENRASLAVLLGLDFRFRGVVLGTADQGFAAGLAALFGHHPSRAIRIGALPGQDGVVRAGRTLGSRNRRGALTGPRIGLDMGFGIDPGGNHGNAHRAFHRNRKL